MQQMELQKIKGDTMKKRILIAVTLLLLIVVVYVLTPAPLIKDANTIEIYKVEQYQKNGENVDIVDITDQIDLAALQNYLTTAQCSRVPEWFVPICLADYQYEISILCHEPQFHGMNLMHLLLGEKNLVYQSSDKGGYKIKNGEAITAFLNAQLENRG